jgi:hypothetical protein
MVDITRADIVSITSGLIGLDDATAGSHEDKNAPNPNNDIIAADET